ncbi:hypothetical protein IFM89_007405 [Coptis chinensis]|uniref:RNase H type-1 domain-containing protein n=1 Tax=Coptis chinensis TaxID=261450 RepID=A0A835IN25_9MAGN|nr:hypothetical protein IFM89_007405 [Coptis chinensis]
MSKSKSTLCRHECRSLCQKLGIQVAFVETEEKSNCWEPPEASRVKLNEDGALNHQGAGHGGLIRDRNGVVLEAFSGSGGRQSVVVQEPRAIEIGESNKPADYLADLCLCLCNQLVYAGPPIDRELVKLIEEDAVGTHYASLSTNYLNRGRMMQSRAKKPNYYILDSPQLGIKSLATEYKVSNGSSTHSQSVLSSLS